MLQHKQLERGLQIGRIEPFDRLSLEARFIIAGATVKRSFAPDAVIVDEGETPEEVLIPVDGAVVRGIAAVRGAFDVPAVLVSRPVHELYRAGPDGCTVLALTKSHMYTLLREYPQMIEVYFDTRER